MRIFLQELKLLFRSLWCLLLYLPILLLTVLLFFFIADTSASTFMNHTGYLLLYLCVFSPVLGVYVAQEIHELEMSMSAPSQVLFCKFMACLLFCTSAILFPFTIIFAICLIGALPLGLVVNYIVFLFVSWITTSFFFICLGFFIGRVLKKRKAYPLTLLVSIITSPFLQNFIVEIFYDARFYPLPVALLNLLNIPFDEPYYTKYISYGMKLDANFYLSQLFYLILGLVLLCGVFLILPTLKKKAHMTGVISGGVIILCLVCFGVYQTSPIIYDFRQDYETRTFADKIDVLMQTPFVDNISVVAYKMDVHLRSAFENNCTVIVQNNGLTQYQDDLVFKLDESLQVSKVLLDGAELSFSREGNRLALHQIDLSPRQTGEIQLSYHGHIRVTDLLHNDTIVCSDNGAYLPELFAWYPKLNTAPALKTFQVTVQAKHALASNLSNHQALKGEDTYYLEGTKEDIYLFSGYIDTIEVNGLPVTLPIEYARRPALRKKLARYVDGMLDGTFTPPKEYFYFYSSNPDLTQRENFLTDQERTQIRSLIMIPFSYNGVGQGYFYDGAIIDSEANLTLIPKL